ncbi:pyridoxal-dependent decarboxylase domain-containing protein 1 [Neocloeon triangulifer]|uniref:pyridoxal-dependent decarboxylase domain-containing protein 1 n=1 Tax=Neocloeon triangulifer TaxID=2078957 RepID=UPI00286F3FE4|nr:pyridoxal-dependent decarboxylase domain-containing protein 1 [Neocloeon triangulifer]
MAEAGVNTKQKMPLAEVEFNAARVISRLEEAVQMEEGGHSWKVSHGLLPLPSRSKDEVMTQLEDLLLHEEGEGVRARLPQLDAPGEVAITSHSVAAYASSLDRPHLQRLATRIASDSTRWLSHMFRFLECNAFYNDDLLEGLVRITRMLLHYKYPEYLEQGYDALQTNPPVIYTSMASPLGLVQHLCRQVGLPLMCVRPVPCNTVFGSHQKMDVAALERAIEDDKLVDKVPLLVLADAGTTIAGHVDNVTRMQEVCRKHDVWLHLRGHGLAALAMASSPTVPSRIADSMTLPLGVWFGVPALPIVTLFRTIEAQEPAPPGVRTRESTLAFLAGLSAEHNMLKLPSLCLWTSLQALGREGILHRLRSAFEASEILHSKLAKYPRLRLLNQRPGGEAGSISITELVKKPISTTVLFEVTSSTVVFQFVPENHNNDERVPDYYDKLNSWLGQILQRDVPEVPLEICELELSGIILRFCPLELSPERLPSHAQIDKFATSMEQQLEILEATVHHKEIFVKLATKCPHLRLVNMPQWAGLGGVRFVPDEEEPDDMTDQRKNELNHLNQRLVDTLRSTDAAFSMGEGENGLICVRFGMVTADTDVEELLNLVVTTGKEVEESSRFLESLTEIVKKGIETATQDLQKENAERVWQEGILRQMPVVGSLVNWWSPLGKETGIKGRSLNLTAGVVESTENIYRYHMQLQGVSPPGTKGPPTPLVQTPIAPPSSQHSRSSSHSSNKEPQAAEQ